MTTLTVSLKLPTTPLDERTFTEISSRFPSTVQWILALEMIESDFTDSVSLILHQLQQEPKLSSRSQSITISEEGTIDDLDEDSDVDESDNKSIADSNYGDKPAPPVEPIPSAKEPTKSIPISNTLTIPEDPSKKKTNLSVSKPFSHSNRSLASSTTSIHRLKIEPKEKKTIVPQRKPNLPMPTPASKTRKQYFRTTTHLSSVSFQRLNGNYQYHWQLYANHRLLFNQKSNLSLREDPSII